MAAEIDRIRVLVSASSQVRLAHLEAIIQNCATAKLVGGMYGLDGLTRHLRQCQPDVLLADLEHGDSRLVLGSSAVDDDDEPVNAIALIDDAQPGWITRALRTNIKAILRRDSPAHDILNAIHAVFSGLVLLEPGFVDGLLQRIPSVIDQVPQPVPEALTARETEVLRMLADGLANKEIASRLGISDHTVKFHISSVLSKMGAASRTEAVTQAIRMGLILI